MVIGFTTTCAISAYLIPRPPSWDDGNYSYDHQLYPSEYFSYIVAVSFVGEEERRVNCSARRM
jgi:hypothetical protein